VIKSAVADRLVDRIKALHGYTVPEIVTFPIASGNPDYLRWVRESAE
jgi:periplasmic divalent cation tolerance protein